jgi:hypothetical protein
MTSTLFIPANDAGRLIEQCILSNFFNKLNDRFWPIVWSGRALQEYFVELADPQLLKEMCASVAWVTSRSTSSFTAGPVSVATSL